MKDIVLLASLSRELSDRANLSPRVDKVTILGAV